jgi:hypothetical protein
MHVGRAFLAQPPPLIYFIDKNKFHATTFYSKNLSSFPKLT